MIEQPEIIAGNVIPQSGLTPAPTAIRKITIGGYAVAFRETGESKIPLILIHGGGSDHSGLVWRSTFQLLAKTRKVIAIDLPGYGESDIPAYRETRGVFPANFRFVAEFANSLGYDHFDLCGFSMGGGVALGCALEFPARVRQLILVNSYGLISKNPGSFLPYLLTKIPVGNLVIRSVLRKSSFAVKLGLRNLFGNRNALTDDIVLEAQDAIRRAGDHPMWEAFLKDQLRPWGFKTRLPQRLGELKTRTLILCGGKDRLFDVHRVQKSLKKGNNPRIQSLVIPECGHLMPLEDGPRMVEEIELFLDAGK